MLPTPKCYWPLTTYTPRSILLGAHGALGAIWSYEQVALNNSSYKKLEHGPGSTDMSKWGPCVIKSPWKIAKRPV